MTAKQVYLGVLVEMNKTNSPSLLLEDFNYMFNKAIYQYINSKYNIYDINQQSTDDIRVLKSTAILQPSLATNTYSSISSSTNSLYGAVYEVNLPLDYLHILNCVCNFKLLKTYECYDKDSYVQIGARRLTADLWSQIIRNFYMMPSYRNPYYYIHNVNSDSNNLPSNPVRITEGEGQISPNTTIQQTTGTDGALPTKILIGGKTVDLIERPGVNRYGNPSQVRLEIRYGKDNSVFQLTDIFVDYIKVPQRIRLTQDQIDMVEDTSQVMEFPDYVCQEIINVLVKLLLENSSDPRLANNVAVNQTIANPVQQQSQPKK
jgi:hypothetical protein